MSTAETIETSLQTPNMIVQAYLDDLSDEDLLVRPIEGANHIAWQLGHLIVSQNSLINQVCPGAMPALPDGFAEKYTKETAQLDDPHAFHSKAELLALMDAQRKAMLESLAGLSDEDLEKPAPEPIQRFGATVGAVFAGQTMHWMMHAGQWAVVRRKLGRPPLF